MPDYRIIPFGSAKTGWALEVDGQMNVTHSSPIYVGAFLEAILRGVGQTDASLIAKTIYGR